MKKKIILFAIIMTFPTIVFSKWVVEKVVDEMSDKVTLYAKTKSKRVVLSLSRVSGNSASLSMRKPGLMFHYENKEVVLRIDKKEMQTIPLDYWSPTFIYFSFTNDLLDELRSGKTLKIRYNVGPSKYITDAFSLKGAAKAINKAIPPF